LSVREIVAGIYSREKIVFGHFYKPPPVEGIKGEVYIKFLEFIRQDYIEIYYQPHFGV
jgi:hypothetical protein